MNKEEKDEMIREAKWRLNNLDITHDIIRITSQDILDLFAENEALKAEINIYKTKLKNDCQCIRCSR